MNIYTFKNKKGETLAVVRAATQSEALYKAGVHGEATVTSVPVVTRSYTISNHTYAYDTN